MGVAECGGCRVWGLRCVEVAVCGGRSVWWLRSGVVTSLRVVACESCSIFGLLCVGISVCGSFSVWVLQHVGFAAHVGYKVWELLSLRIAEFGDCSG